MKKIILIIMVIFITACSKTKTASDVVSDYLNKYQNLDKEVTKELDKIISQNKDLNDENKKIYKKIFIKDYKDLKYTILSEDYNDNMALIKVNINVYDINKAEDLAFEYLSKNLKEFYNENNTFNNDKYTKYKLELIYNNLDKIDYEVIFYLNYKNKRWVLKNPTDEDLEKIHGIYKENMN